MIRHRAIIIINIAIVCNCTTEKTRNQNINTQYTHSSLFFSLERGRL